MRLTFDILILLMLAVILGGVVWVQYERGTQRDRIAQVHEALAKLSEGMRYEAAMQRAIEGEEGFPRAISPQWFPHGLPVNHLLPPEHPWIDVAPPGDRSEHPPDPIVDSAAQASFWYNPSRGLFRARVPAQLSETASLTLYNEVNHSELEELPNRRDTARRPLPNWPEGGDRVVPVTGEADPRRSSSAPAGSTDTAAPSRSRSGSAAGEVPDRPATGDDRQERPDAGDAADPASTPSSSPSPRPRRARPGGLRG